MNTLITFNPEAIVGGVLSVGGEGVVSGEEIFNAYKRWYEENSIVQPFDFKYDAAADTLDIGDWSIDLNTAEKISSNVIAFMHETANNEIEKPMTTAAAIDISIEIAQKENGQPPAVIDFSPDVLTAQPSSDVLNATTDQNVLSVNADKKPKPASSEDITRLLATGVGGNAKPAKHNNPKQKTKSTNQNPAHAQKPKHENKQRTPLPKNIPTQVRNTDRAVSFLEKAIEQNRGPGVDGVDFINISNKGETKLGQALDLPTFLKFNYQNIGHFNSVSALQFYLTTDVPDEELRTLAGPHCYTLQHKIKTHSVEGLYHILADATWVKINSYPALAIDIVNNELPYMSFYYPANSIYAKQTFHGDWLVPVIEEIAATLKEINKTGNKELVPDFSFLDDYLE